MSNQPLKTSASSTSSDATGASVTKEQNRSVFLLPLLFLTPAQTTLCVWVKPSLHGITLQPTFWARQSAHTNRVSEYCWSTESAHTTVLGMRSRAVRKRSVEPKHSSAVRPSFEILRLLFSLCAFVLPPNLTYCGNAIRATTKVDLLW